MRQLPIQHADKSIPDLLDALSRSQKALRELETRKLLPDVNTAALDRLRKENVILQTELRAELRRRGAT